MAVTIAAKWWVSERLLLAIHIEVRWAIDPEGFDMDSRLHVEPKHHQIAIIEKNYRGQLEHIGEDAKKIWLEHRYHAYRLANYYRRI